MDPSNYKSAKVSRGLTYSYYYAAPKDGRPVLLLLHGWPSSPFDFKKQIAFFNEGKGYGIIAPDMLGYGGTDKPLDAALYQATGLSQDVLDILDAEKVDKPIVVAHDWGVKVASRLANLHSDRFSGFAFLAASYLVPSPNFNIDVVLEMTKKAFGIELFGYWKFLSEDGADTIIDEHLDSLFSLLFTSENTLLTSDFAPPGKLKQWLVEDQQTELVSYLSHKEWTIQRDTYKKTGIAASLNWYKVMVSGLNAEDDKTVPLDKYTITKPVFFAGAKYDPILNVDVAKKTLAQYCPNATVHVFEADHWVMLHAADELNGKLDEWFETL